MAVGLFNERGYDGTSMRDLAARLGIAKSAIYHHVAGKEELLSLALDRALGGLSVVVGRARALPAPASERLEYLVRGSVEVLQAESPYVTLLLRVRGNTDVERAALEQRRAFDRFVAELVAEAVRDGDIRPDVDAMLTARLLFGLVNSIVEWYRPDRGEASLADQVCAIAFDGLRPGAAARVSSGSRSRGPGRPAAGGQGRDAGLAQQRAALSRPASVCLLCASGAPAMAPKASSGCTSYSGCPQVSRYRPAARARPGPGSAPELGPGPGTSRMTATQPRRQASTPVTRILPTVTPCSFSRRLLRRGTRGRARGAVKVSWWPRASPALPVTGRWLPGAAGPARLDCARWSFPAVRSASAAPRRMRCRTLSLSWS